MSVTLVPVPFEDLEPQAFQLPNGVELHGVFGGEGAPLVFIHGAMGDWRSWQPQWEAFSAHYACLSYSRRYSFPNRNDMPSPHHCALDEAQDLRLLLEVIGWDRVILVGSSYGGFTALALALADPDRIKAVVAVEPPMMRYAHLTEAGRRAAEDFRTSTIEPANAAFRRGDDERAAQIMTGGINGAGSSNNGGEAMRRRLQNMRAMKMLALSTDEFPWFEPDRLAALHMPVLLMSGAETPPVHRAIFDNLCPAMPQAEVIRVSGAGHGVSRDQPLVFNERVLEFLRSRAS